jgi:hypothetical protein
VAVVATLLIVVGLCYVVRGYALPGAWIGAILATVPLAAATLWAVRRLSVERTARFTDGFFQLHDAVTSYLHFASQGRRDGYYALQAQQTAERVAGLDSDAIRYQPPKRLSCLALGLLAVAIPISLCPPSDEVLDRLAMEERVEEESAAIKEALLKEADKLAEETRDKEEEKLVEPNKLRRWVDELKTTKDRTEALRQYARLEHKLDEKRQSLQRKEDEQLLERAAAELAKGEETKSMAETLTKKEYDKAAEDLKNLKPNKSKSADQQRRDMARLKSVAQRMALAARPVKSPARNAKPAAGKQSDASSSSGKQGESAAGGNGAKKTPGKSGTSSDGGLAETIDELAEAVEELDKAEDCKEKCESCQKAFCERVDKLADQLKKLAICRRADCRLGKLCRRCGECQSNMCCASPNAGGHKAGWGSNTARRNERDALVDNGQTTQLKGIKGSGPSITAVEAAESGSGVSNRGGAARQRAFKHQFESFVQREDVPETVRDGVKQYFQIIHEADSETSSKGDSKK